MKKNRLVQTEARELVTFYWAVPSTKPSQIRARVGVAVKDRYSLANSGFTLRRYKEVMKYSTCMELGTVGEVLITLQRA